MTREDIFGSILRSNLANSSQNHHVSTFLIPQTLRHDLLENCTGLRVACSWSLPPSPEPTFVEQQRQHLGSDFLVATQPCGRGGGVVACFAPPAVKTVALGAPRRSAHCESQEPILLGTVFWGPAMSPQVAETFWPLLMRDYTKEALF